MSWSSQRRTSYLLVFLAIIIALGALVTYLFFYEAPTCTDGIQNGTEEGIDCGGDCPIVCAFSAAEPVIEWTRVFEVIPGVYTAVTLVRNPNTSLATYNLPYTTKLRGTDALLVAEKQGTLYLPPDATVPLIEIGIQTGSRIPVRGETTIGIPVWVNESREESATTITRTELSHASTSPRLTAEITNTTLDDIIALPVVAILYGVDGNAIHASRTVIERLPARSSANLTFTWPQPFLTSVATIDIIPVRSVETR